MRVVPVDLEVRNFSGDQSRAQPIAARLSRPTSPVVVPAGAEPWGLRAAPRTGEVRLMSHRSLKHLLFVTLLAGGLALAAPAQVHAAPLGPAQGAWEWLTRVWREGVAVFWGQPGVEHPIPTESRPWDKQGGCVDPNGCANAATTSTRPRCQLWNEQGVCVDPNG